MKTFLSFSMLLFFLFSANFSIGQEQKSTVNSVTDPNIKAQDHNSSRSNKTASSVAPDSGKPDGNESNNNANSKKGYDYYKAKSDLNSAGAKAPDQNSSGGDKPLQGNTKENSETVNKAFNQNSARSSNPQPKK